MSRTHKTKPFWVKMRQGHIPVSEYHNHTDGQCDLPQEVGPDYWRRMPHCHHTWEYDGSGMLHCGCHHYECEKTEREQKQRRQLRDHPERWDGEWVHDWAECLGCKLCS